MMRDLLRPAVSLLRSAIGTNGIALRMAALEARIDSLRLHLETPAALEERPVEDIAERMSAIERRLHQESKPQEDEAFVTVKLPSGAAYELSVATKDRDIYHSSVAAEGAYDDNWHFLNAWVRPGDVFFDLGANIGTISVPAAVNGATVHAFELLDANVQHLVRSVRRNSLLSMSITLGAISDKEGFVGIGGFSAWGTVVPTALISIPTVVVDTYVRSRKVSIVNIMKIDVEGSEKAALYGATGLIERDHPDILIECNAVTCGNHGYSYRELLRFLEARGYRLFRLHGRRLCPWTADAVQEVVYTDYFATTKSGTETASRSGWRVSDLTSDEMIANIVQQDLYGDLHRLFVLAVEATLPPAIKCDERVSALLTKWATTRDAEAIAVLRTGAA
jgi:FkbM family methyltransferase